MRTSRIATVAAATLLLVGTAACGSQDSSGSSSSSSATSGSGATAGDTGASASPTDATTTPASSSTDATTAPGSSSTSVPNGKARAPLEPRNLDATSHGLVANPAGPTTNVLREYADPQCPFCRKAEEATSASVQKAAAANTVRVVFHPMTFLDDMVKNDSSKRMANAAVCASDAKGKLLPFLKAMYALQPAKEGDGYPADAAKHIADTIGLTGTERVTYDSCVKDNTYLPWIAQVQSKYAADGIDGTPTYILNGKKVDFTSFVLADFEKQLAGKK